MQKPIPTALLFQNIITNIENNRLIKANISKNVKIIRYLSFIPFLFGSSVDFVNDDAVRVLYMPKYESISRRTSSFLQNSDNENFLPCKLLPFSMFCLHRCHLLLLAEMLPNNYITFKVYLKKLMKIAANAMFLRKCYASGMCMLFDRNGICRKFDQDIWILDYFTLYSF